MVRVRACEHVCVRECVRVCTCVRESVHVRTCERVSSCERVREGRVSGPVCPCMPTLSRRAHPSGVLDSLRGGCLGGTGGSYLWGAEATRVPRGVRGAAPPFCTCPVRDGTRRVLRDLGPAESEGRSFRRVGAWSGISVPACRATCALSVLLLARAPDLRPPLSSEVSPATPFKGPGSEKRVPGAEQEP